MGSVMGPAALQAAAAEAKSYLRVEGPQEDALVERLAGTAATLCEAFTGRWLLAREGAETVAAGSGWKRLRATPVRAILGVDALPIDGAPVALEAGAYAIDIDAAGDGWVRLAAPIEANPSTALRTGRARVRFQAGLAEAWADLPEPLRQGIVRLAAHLFTHRSGAGEGAPPAAVTALWRPYRRLHV